MLELLEAQFGDQFEEILKLLGDPPDLSKLPADFWDGMTAEMAAKMRPILEKGARQAAGRMVLEEGIGVDWTLIAENAARWASNYSFSLVTDVTDTTRRALQDSVERFIREPGRTIGDLTADLEPYFKQARAQMIAVTETTRAFVVGERTTVAEWERYGAKLEAVWHTNRDELVCEACGPLDGRPESEWGIVTEPPAHPRCRCWITHRTIEEVEAKEQLTTEELRRAVQAKGPYSTRAQSLTGEWVEEHKSAHKTRVQKDGMSKPELMRSVEFEGLTFYYRDTVQGRSVMNYTLQQWARGAKLPECVLEPTKTIYLTSQDNNQDAYWARQYKLPNFHALATAGKGEITVYGSHTIGYGSMVHEMGHNWARSIWKTPRPPDDSGFARATRAAEPPTRYARTARAEDFAESTRLYFGSVFDRYALPAGRLHAIEQLLKEAGYGR